MPSGKINNPVKYYASKKLRWLGALWAVFLVCMGVIVTLFLVTVPSAVKWLGTLIALLIALMMVFYSKPRINFNDMRHRYELLIANNVGTVNTTCEFNQLWLNSLSAKGFKMDTDNHLIQVWYRFDKSLARKTFIKTHALTIVTIIKSKSLDLYDDVIEAVYKKLWLQHEREQKLNKQIIMQFRQVNAFDQKTKDDLNRIISYREGDNYMISINIGYLADKNQIYYLHTNKYAPNAYYQYAVEQIKALTT